MRLVVEAIVDATGKHSSARNFSEKKEFPLPPGGWMYLTIVRVRIMRAISRASINSRTPRNFLRVIAVIYNTVGIMRCESGFLPRTA